MPILKSFGVALLACGPWFANAEAAPAETSPRQGEDEKWLEGKMEPEIAPPVKAPFSGLAEDPEKWYFGVGMRLRMHVIPAFVYSFKVVGAYTEVSYGVGVEATFRIKYLDIIPAVWFYDMSHKDTPMREKGDEITETEIIVNKMRLVMITVDFLNSVRILDWLYFSYGAGIGLGVPTTRIKRYEAYPMNEPQTEFGKCSGPGMPIGGPWCESDGHYGEEDPWPVYPYLNILFGLRFKPIPNFVTNLDMGIGPGFIIGMRASYLF